MNPATGGPCEGIRNLIPELKQQGVLADVVCLDNPYEEFLKEYTFPIYALGASRTPWKYNPQLLHWLVAHMNSYDVVIIRGNWLYHGYAVKKAIQILKKKKINNLPRVYVMPHGMLDPWFQQAKTRRMKALRNRIYWHLIEKKIIQNSNGVLFTCQMELEIAKKTFHDYKPQSEINIGYGIQQPPHFTDLMNQEFQAKCPQLVNEPFILFLGRVDEKKGIDLLLEAYKKLLNSGYILPKLVIAGPGKDSQYGKKLKIRIRNSQRLSTYVFFLGMLTGNAKWGAFYRCDAFVLPSHQENFGIAVVEAMACGKAVLVSNRINIFKEISNAGAGLVDADTLEGVCSLIKKWIKISANEKHEMMLQAKHIFNAQFTIQAAAQKMISALSIK